MVLLSLFLPVVPNAKTAFSGLPASAAQVMSLLSMVLLSLPVVAVVVLKSTIPAAASVEEPFSVQYCTVLLDASPINRMVEVPAVATALVLVMVKLFVVPVVFTLPSMVTLSAPLRLIKGVAKAPVMLKPVVVG